MKPLINLTIAAAIAATAQHVWTLYHGAILTITHKLAAWF